MCIVGVPPGTGLGNTALHIILWWYNDTVMVSDGNTMVTQMLQMIYNHTLLCG